MTEYPLTVDTKGSDTTIESDDKVIQVDYSNDESIKNALTGVEVVISTMDAGGPRCPKEDRCGGEGSGRQVVRSFRVRRKHGRRHRGDARRIVRGKGEYSGPTEGFGYPIRRRSRITFGRRTYSLTFGYSAQLTTGPKVLKLRREGVRW